jgi:hypothetical protein
VVQASRPDLSALRLWVPTPERALALIVSVGVITLAGAWLTGAAPDSPPDWLTPAIAVPAPAQGAQAAPAGGGGLTLPFGLFRPAPVGPVVLERGPAEGVLRIDDVLPLSRNLQALPDATGALTPALMLQTWSDPAGMEQRYREWGFTAGVVTTFWRPELSNEPAAPITVRSQVALFRDVNAADSALRLRRERMAEAKATPLTLAGPVPGDALAYRTGSGPFAVYLVEFRRANALATLTVVGYAGAVATPTVQRLADLLAARVR